MPAWSRRHHYNTRCYWWTIPACGRGHRGTTELDQMGEQVHLDTDRFCIEVPRGYPLAKDWCWNSGWWAICTTFTRFGIPQEILSDQGSQFMATLTKRLMELLEVKQLHTSPYHPHTDGMLASTAHSSGCYRRRGISGKIGIPYAALHSASGYSPFQLLWTRCSRPPLHAEKPTHWREHRKSPCGRVCAENERPSALSLEDCNGEWWGGQAEIQDLPWQVQHGLYKVLGGGEGEQPDIELLPRSIGNG